MSKRIGTWFCVWRTGLPNQKVVLKLCVSSRELPTFLDRLPSDQRIRLQDLTNEDLRKVVDQGLESNDHFRALQTRSPEDCIALKAKIAEKADGVFLWAIMTLKMLFEALERRDSLRELFSKIDSLPEELEDFFRFILDSIPKDVRRKAYCSLLYALHVGNNIMDSSTTSYMSIIYAASSLLRWSYIDRFIDNEEFVDTLDLIDMDTDDMVETHGICCSTATRKMQRFDGIKRNRRPRSISAGQEEPEACNSALLCHIHTQVYS